MQLRANFRYHSKLQFPNSSHYACALAMTSITEHMDKSNLHSPAHKPLTHSTSNTTLAT